MSFQWVLSGDSERVSLSIEHITKSLNDLSNLCASLGHLFHSSFLVLRKIFLDTSEDTFNVCHLTSSLRDLEIDILDSESATIALDDGSLEVIGVLDLEDVF
jgi:hypothetical protein